MDIPIVRWAAIAILSVAGLVMIALLVNDYRTRPEEYVTFELYYVTGSKEVVTYRLPKHTKFRIIDGWGTYKLNGNCNGFQVFGVQGVVRYKIISREDIE